MKKGKKEKGTKSFLDSLANNIDSYESKLKDEQVGMGKESSAKRSVTFGTRIQKRAFDKSKPPASFEEEGEEDESEYKERSALLRQEEKEDEEEDSTDSEEEESDDGSPYPSFDNEDENDLEESTSSEDDEEEEESEDEGYFSDDFEEEEEGDFDDSEEDEDDEDMEFDSLSPAEQLKLLMEPVEDDEEEDEEEDFDEEGGEFDEEDEEDEEIEPLKISKKKLSLGDDSDEDDETVVKSTFEKQQERLRRTISEFEAENVGEKPWMLRGEVNASARPVNSLLEEDIDFEHASKAAPVITEEVTESLENIIRQRIKDRAWDDVERKLAPTTAPKRRLAELDTERSAKSLSEVYEQETLEKQEKRDSKAEKDKEYPIDEATKKIHEEIGTLFTKVCKEIDGLSRNMFAPRTYALADIEIKTKKPKVK